MSSQSRTADVVPAAPPPPRAVRAPARSDLAEAQAGNKRRLIELLAHDAPSDTLSVGAEHDAPPRAFLSAVEDLFNAATRWLQALNIHIDSVPAVAAVHVWGADAPTPGAALYEGVMKIMSLVATQDYEQAGVLAAMLDNGVLAGLVASGASRSLGMRLVDVAAVDAVARPQDGSVVLQLDGGRLHVPRNARATLADATHVVLDVDPDQVMVLDAAGRLTALREARIEVDRALDDVDVEPAVLLGRAAAGAVYQSPAAKDAGVELLEVVARVDIAGQRLLTAVRPAAAARAGRLAADLVLGACDMAIAAGALSGRAARLLAAEPLTLEPARPDDAAPIGNVLRSAVITTATALSAGATYIAATGFGLSTAVMVAAFLGSVAIAPLARSIRDRDPAGRRRRTRAVNA